MHNCSRARFRSYNYAIALPAIVISTVSGTGTIGIGMHDGSKANWVSILFGCMALTSASLFAVHRYMQLPELQSQHDIYSDEFEKLEAEIKMHVALLVDMESGDTNDVSAFRNVGELTKHVKKTLDCLIDKAPAIQSDIARDEAAAPPIAMRHGDVRIDVGG